MKKDWKQSLVLPNDSIRDALVHIDEQALRVALVVDEKMNLHGVITDGDVRRGLLRGLTLDDPVRDIMNTSPITAQDGTERKELVEIMERRDILAIPIVSGTKIIGLETLHHVLMKPRLDNPVFIMAGGFGTRLRPLTDTCPKPMLKVGEKPILETIVRHFKNCGFHNFYISTHYMPEIIQSHFEDGSAFGVNISYVQEDIPLGTGGALGLLPNDISELPLIVINGDVLTNIDFSKLVSFHQRENAKATMCVREYEYQIPYGVIEGEGVHVSAIVEKPIHRFNINAGIYVLNAEVHKSVSKNERIDLPTVLEQQMDSGCRVTMYPIHEYWLDIGQMADFKKAQKDILTLGI